MKGTRWVVGSNKIFEDWVAIYEDPEEALERFEEAKVEAERHQQLCLDRGLDRHSETYQVFMSQLDKQVTYLG